MAHPEKLGRHAPPLKHKVNDRDVVRSVEKSKSLWLWCNSDGEIIRCNKKVLRVLNNAMENSHLLLPVDHHALVEECFEKDEERQVESTYYDREYRWQYTPSPSGLIAIEGHDVTEERKNYRDARRHSLTHLLNRLGFEEELAVIIRERKGEKDLFVTVVMADLDGLKKINDDPRYGGHDIGDYALKTIATRLRKSFRDTDIVAHISGDEFGIILVVEAKDEDRAKSKVETFLRKMLDTVNRPIPHPDHQNYLLPLSISVGAALKRLDKTGCDKDQLIRAADDELYAAKRSGGGRYSI